MTLYTDNADAELADAIVQTKYWVEHAVVGLNLCPFAKSVLHTPRLRWVASDARTEDALLADLDAELSYFAQQDSKTLETTLLIHPYVLTDFMAFNDFNEIIDALILAREEEGIFQVAQFHPQFQFSDTQANAPENYTNRAPFPTLHLLREESLSEALETFPNPDSIFENNIQTMQKLGLNKIRALYHGGRLPGEG